MDTIFSNYHFSHFIYIKVSPTRLKISIMHSSLFSYVDGIRNTARQSLIILFHSSTSSSCLQQKQYLTRCLVHLRCLTFQRDH